MAGLATLTLQDLRSLCLRISCQILGGSKSTIGLAISSILPYPLKGVSTHINIFHRFHSMSDLEDSKPFTADDDCSKGLYGSFPLDELHQLKSISGKELTKVAHVSSMIDSESLRIRARFTSKRIKGNRGFIVLRQGSSSVQAIISVEPGVISKPMLRFCGGIPNESIVEIVGTVAKTKFPITSCTVTDAEIKIKKIFVVSAAERLPFDYEDACRPETELEKDPKAIHVNLDTRLDSRYMDLRTPANRAIFTMQSGVCQLFREYLQARGFMEIHTPKLLSTPSEGGASVFEVKYFKGNAYLAQSPQFYKQIMICSDYDRVFEIGPVFRAENSQTHRHLTEFTGLDMEMAFSDDYTEVLDTIECLFMHIFSNLEEKFSEEIATVRAQFNLTEFKYLQKALRLNYSDGIKLLQDDGLDIGLTDDLSTENEKRLGKLIKEKYKTDFYTLNKFPLHLRPFYTMPDPENKELSNSYDIYMRGEEVLSGGQRVSDAKLLTERIEALGISPDTMKNYVDAFRCGAPPHAGGGIGMS